MTDEEYESGIKSLFDAVDANADGILQLDEFKQFMISVSQSSGIDGATIASLQSRNDIFSNQLFTLMDTSGDGNLQWDEVWAEMCNKKHNLKNDD